MKKRKDNSLKLILILIVCLAGIIFLLTTNLSFIGKHSIHSDAKRYSNRHCLIFYPDSADGKAFAKSLCKNNKEDKIYDYSLVPYGDYYLVDYGSYQYFADKEYKAIKIEKVSEAGKRIISDYLRYDMKKNDPERYFDLDFLESSYVDNLSLDDVTYDIDGVNLVCHFPEYDMDVHVPLRYMQDILNMDFGYPEEEYVKPTYIIDDEKYPVICLTFDDGPQFWYEYDECDSVKIVDSLYRYDACGTFYVVGDCLEERDCWNDHDALMFLRDSISKGNEYGSHTQDHSTYLTDYSSSEAIRNAINGPAEYMKEELGYEMKTYRPVGGFFDDDVLASQDLPAILWDIDSYDWGAESSEEVYETVMKYEMADGDIIIFHDIYDISAEAITRIVPELIEKGCQLVSVSEMLRYLGLDVSSLSYYYNNGYYE